MKEMFIDLFRSLKLSFSEKSNVIIWLLVLNLAYMTYLHIESCNDRYHFYKNINTSLEAIHNVELDTYDGKIKRNLTTEEELIRKQNRRFHIQYLFK